MRSITQKKKAIYVCVLVINKCKLLPKNEEAMTSSVVDLFTRRTTSYDRFISLLLYEQGIRSYFRHSLLLRTDLRILDAGCGTGVVSDVAKPATVARSRKTDRGIPIHPTADSAASRLFSARLKMMPLPKGPPRLEYDALNGFPARSAEACFE